MKLTERLTPDKPHVSFEISPPPFGKGRERAFEIFDQLMPGNPAFISITFHQEIVSYNPAEEDRYQKVVEKAKAGTIPLCALLEGHYNLPVVQHLLCGGFTREETAYALKEMAYVNLDNVFALRGDPRPGEKVFIPEEGGHKYASQLVEQIASFNRGEHTLNGVQDKVKTNFCIGVTGYPEKHYQALNEEIDLQRLKRKVDAGADYIITQMFYDNSSFFDFVNRAREAGINVPIIPGLNPIVDETDFDMIPGTFHISIPPRIVNQFHDKKPLAEVSTEVLTQQAQELLQKGVPNLHFYTEGRNSKIKIVNEVYRRLFG